jgi:hypothetical protein
VTWPLSIRATCRRPILVLAVVLAVLVVACSSGKKLSSAKLEPVLLAQLALAPADLGGAYVVTQDRYVDEDGQTVAEPTNEFVRQLSARPSQTPSGEDAAVTVLVSLANQGEGAAADFIDAADDQDVGPPNLESYIEQQVSGSHDVHAELVEDFPSYDDDTVANKLTWQQDANGSEQTWAAYGVYVRAGGLISLVALRAPAAADGAEPEGLRHEAESATKKQAEKLKSGTPAVVKPR